MATAIPPLAQRFSERLLACPIDGLEAFAEAEIMTGPPFIFGNADDTLAFQRYVAASLGVPAAASHVLVVGSAKTGFSLDPDRYFQPFGPASDIDVAVINEDLFDEAWRAMLAWDYATMRTRTAQDRRWLSDRRFNVWSGWYDPAGWELRERGEIHLTLPAILRPLRDFSYRWFWTFRSLSRYRYHREVPRHRVDARLYRTRRHLAMYHASGLRILRTRLTG